MNVDVDATFETLERASVRMCFEHAVPRRLLFGSAVRDESVSSAAVVMPDGDEPLVVVGRELELGARPPGTCVRYTVDVAPSGRDVAKFGRDLLAANSAWLLRPDPLPDDVRGTAQVAVPAGYAASLPWPRAAAGRSLLDAGAFRILSRLAIVSTPPRELDVPGGRITLARLDGPLGMTEAELDTWIAGAAGCASLITGRFPTPEAQVVLLPVGPSSSALGFGQATRGGGPAVMLMVPSSSTLSEVQRDWVTVHELSHLAFPYLERGDAFLSEGFATYYQEVLRSRGGKIREVDAWYSLLDGFDRGARSDTGETLREASRNMYRTFAFERVYWAGTALFLLADVELRRRAGAAPSLDAIVEPLLACAGPAVRGIDAERVVECFDAAAGAPVLGGLLERWGGAREFPDVREALGWLGVSRDASGRVVLDDAAPGAAARRAITSARLRER